MSDQFIGQVLAEKYRIEEVLRDGEFVKIYRGRHLLMDKPVTVKILSPALSVDDEIVRRFSQEARTVSALSHPNVLNVNDFGTDKSGAVYIIMEGAEGRTLAEVLETENAFPVERAVRIARQTAAALSAAHAHGIIHQNLNPDNILLSGQPGSRGETVKVLDFGSFEADESAALDDISAAKNLEYRAPEQDSGVVEADERADIYALGVVFYRMLAGDAPFTADTPTDLMLKKVEELPAPLSAFRDDVPEGIEPVILKALSKNRDARQQSAAEFIEELNRATDYSNELETVIAAPPTAPAESNNLWKTAFIVLAGISLLSIGLIYATYTKQTDPTTSLQYDANGQPVQPINPATGIPEQGASNMIPFDANTFANANVTDPGQLTYPDGVNPWGEGKFTPPPDSSIPYPVQPGGELITIPGQGGSQFMPQLDSNGGIILIPVPANTNVNANTAVPAKTPRQPANTQPSPTPADEETPAAKPPAAKPSPETKPTTPPPTKPAPANRAPQTPKENTPAQSEGRLESGKTQKTD